MAKLSNKKKRLIIKSKIATWEFRIASLDSTDGQPHMWTFIKSMLGKGNNFQSDGSQIEVQGNHLISPQDKAKHFLYLLSMDYSSCGPSNDRFKSFITSKILPDKPNTLNSPITLTELKKKPKTFPKSKAFSPDYRNNEMLFNLSKTNLFNFLHLFNTLFQNKSVPQKVSYTHLRRDSEKVFQLRTTLPIWIMRSK